jgi:hypothetical protein
VGDQASSLLELQTRAGARGCGRLHEQECGSQKYPVQTQGGKQGHYGDDCYCYESKNGVHRASPWLSWGLWFFVAAYRQWEWHTAGQTQYVENK